MRHDAKMEVSMGVNNYLMRGSSLRITEWIEVLVIFTGEECKIYQTKPKTITKYSLLSQKTRKLIIGLFFTLLILSLIMTYFHY